MPRQHITYRLHSYHWKLLTLSYPILCYRPDGYTRVYLSANIIASRVVPTILGKPIVSSIHIVYFFLSVSNCSCHRVIYLPLSNALLWSVCILPASTVYPIPHAHTPIQHKSGLPCIYIPHLNLSSLSPLQLTMQLPEHYLEPLRGCNNTSYNEAACCLIKQNHPYLPSYPGNSKRIECVEDEEHLRWTDEAICEDDLRLSRGTDRNRTECRVVEWMKHRRLERRRRCHIVISKKVKKTNLQSSSRKSKDFWSFWNIGKISFDHSKKNS